MRIDQVRAGAFGPLRGDRLDLAPGLTVVHGPNEAGKSSWFAATYAGLVGRRKARGRGTLAQAAFAQRHKPWSGAQWSAGVTVTLDDGTSLALEHDLRKGEGRIMDVTTGRPLALADAERRLGRELTTEGGLDGARILGLNREGARSTIFVAQADILRVMHDAAELQELLERVATSETADVTAEAALQWLARLRSERVGVAHVGTRPLRAGTAALEEARAAAIRARDHWGDLLEVIAEHREVDARERQAKLEVDRLEQAQQWRTVLELERRLEQVRDLAAAGDEDRAAEPADDKVVRRATVLLGAFDDRGPQPTSPEATDSESLRAQLESLPDAPDGDLEPRAEIVEARDELAAAMAALAGHEESAPEVAEVPTTPVEPEMLRGLATRIAEPSPEVDPALERRVEEARQAHEAAQAAYASAEADHRAAVDRNRSRQQAYDEQLTTYHREQEEFLARMRDHEAAVAAEGRARAEAAEQQRRARLAAISLAVGGGVAVLVGLALVVAGQVAAGATVAGLGLALAGVGLVRGSRRAPSTPTTGGAAAAMPVAPAPPEAPQFESADVPQRPEPVPELTTRTAELAAQRLAVEDHQRAVSSARARLDELALPADAAELRRLARALDDAAGASERVERHRQQAVQLAERRNGAAQRLAALLEVSLPGLGPDQQVGELQRAFEKYVEQCRHRARQAVEASRRQDLERSLEQRVEIEQAHQRAVAEWERRATDLAALARELGAPEQAADASAWLRSWVAEQEERRAALGDRQERRGRLDQLLEGRSVEDLQGEVSELRSRLGAQPEHVPEDIEEELDAWRRRHQGFLGQVGGLRGRQRQLTSDLPPLPQVLEEEAGAERTLTAVRELAAGLEVAAAELAKAKERSHASVAPALEAVVRPHVPRVTHGRYLDVRINPADLTMKVTEASGAARDAHLLSHGTTEQLYLLLRVALAQTLASVEETAPLVLDDVTVQSDRGRTGAVLDLLHEVSRDRQVVLFSQEDEVVAWAEEHLQEPRDRLVALSEAAGR